MLSRPSWPLSRPSRPLGGQSGGLPSCTWHAEPRAEGLVDEQQGGPPGPRACSRWAGLN